MRSTKVQFDITTDDGHTTHFSTPDLTGMAQKVTILLEFDSDGRRFSHVVELPVEFLDPDEIHVRWTDPPPDARQMRAVGERLVQLAEELRGDE